MASPAGPRENGGMRREARRIVMAVTGASGMPYARRCLQAFVAAGVETHLLFSKTAVELVKDELGIALGSSETWVARFLGAPSERVILHKTEQYHAAVASGGLPTDGMVVIPCSVGRLGAFAAGISRDLIDRAVEVTLKEGRRLVLVPRETPLSQTAIGNMLTLARAGAVVLPAMPAFYTRPGTVDDMVSFVVGKVLDQFGVPHALFARYGVPGAEPAPAPGAQPAQADVRNSARGAPDAALETRRSERGV